MIIQKGTNLIVKDSRKGTYKATAIRDFDTETDEWFPVETKEWVFGLQTRWCPGEEIPCRKSLATICIDEEETT